MLMKVQEGYRTPNRVDHKKVPLPHNKQNTKHTEKRKIAKSRKGKKPSNI